MTKEEQLNELLRNIFVLKSIYDHDGYIAGDLVFTCLLDGTDLNYDQISKMFKTVEDGETEEGQ